MKAHRGFNWALAGLLGACAVPGVVLAEQPDDVPEVAANPDATEADVALPVDLASDSASFGLDQAAAAIEDGEAYGAARAEAGADNADAASTAADNAANAASNAADAAENAADAATDAADNAADAADVAADVAEAATENAGIGLRP